MKYSHNKCPVTKEELPMGVYGLLIPIYDRAFYFCADLTQLEEFLGCEPVPNPEGFCGMCIDCTDGVAMYLPVEEDYTFSIDTLVHESFHVAMMISDQVGIKTNTLDDEAGAYIAGYVAKHIIEFIENMKLVEASEHPGFDEDDFKEPEYLKKDRLVATINPETSEAEVALRQLLEKDSVELKGNKEAKPVQVQINPIKHYIFDLDDTLMDAGHRKHLMATSAEGNWTPYNAAAAFDVPLPAADIFRALRSQPDTIVHIITGRGAAYRDLTIDVLGHFDLLPTGGLYMRPPKSHQHDNILKPRLLTRLLLEHNCLLDDIVCCFDDRTTVVEMYRSLGLTVCQVQQNDF